MLSSIYYSPAWKAAPYSNHLVCLSVCLSLILFLDDDFSLDGSIVFKLDVCITHHLKKTSIDLGVKGQS